MQADELILTEVLNCSRSDLYLKKPVLTPEEGKIFNQMKQRYSLGEPLQYVIGSADFMGHRFFVNPNVLIPRPETEILVEQICHQYDKDASLDILDLGTGSGCIAISLLKHFKSARVTAVDISQEALDIALQNAKELGVSERIEFVADDMENFLKRCDGSFNLIVSNPPYIRSQDLNGLPADVKKEPKIALDGGEDGLNYYRIILKSAANLLKVDGRVCFEFGDGQAEDIKSIAGEDFKSQIICDYTKTERIIFLQKGLV